MRRRSKRLYREYRREGWRGEVDSWAELELPYGLLTCRVSDLSLRGRFEMPRFWGNEPENQRQWPSYISGNESDPTTSPGKMSALIGDRRIWGISELSRLWGRSCRYGVNDDIKAKEEWWDFSQLRRREVDKMKWLRTEAEQSWDFFAFSGRLISNDTWHSLSWWLGTKRELFTFHILDYISSESYKFVYQ